MFCRSSAHESIRCVTSQHNPGYLAEMDPRVVVSHSGEQGGGINSLGPYSKSKNATNPPT